MFRIKTDIRQYKCETKDKVEKLIRNWVIRPSDLIYNIDEREWLPIGEHPAFVSLFGVLEEQEQNTPDTVVTARSPYSSRPVAPKDNGVGETDSEEVTHVVERPDFDDEDEEGDEEVVDARETDIFEEEEIAKSLADDKRDPPEAPEGVEPPSNDEVTMMTEKTLEMLKVDDHGEADAQAPGDDAKTDDETTDLREAPEGDGEDEEAEEITDVHERETSDEEDDHPPSVVVADQAEEDEEKTPTDAPRMGRHDLPEELFATNEISSPYAREQLNRIDDLAELSDTSEASEPEEDTDEEADEEEWDALHQDSGVDEAWDAIAEDLRVTEEISETSDPEVAALQDTDELERGEDEVDSEAEEEEELGEWESEDTLEPEIHPVDFISDGYKIPLPFPIEPTPLDIERGLRPSRASKARRNRTYPLPEPKTPDEVHTRYFDLTPRPPRDQTIIIAIGFVIVISFIATITMC